jgi:hypothetical protein
MTVNVISQILASAVNSSPTGYKLAYPPPTLVNPVTVNLGPSTSVNTQATGSSTTGLDNTKDYIIVLPTGAVRTTTIQINGGRNIVVIGGHIGMAVQTDAAVLITDNSTNGAAAPQSGRVVHIEGILADNPNDLSFDGLDYNCPSAIVQFQNCRVVGMTGSLNAVHADISQNQGGAIAVRYDHVSGTTDYQGFFLPLAGGTITNGALISNVDLSFWQANSSNPYTDIFWNYNSNEPSENNPVDIVGPFVISNNRSGQTVLNNSIYAVGSSLSEDGSGNITFASGAGVSGAIIDGNMNPNAIPAGGFCAVGDCGIGYVSPGYI